MKTFNANTMKITIGGEEFKPCSTFAFSKGRQHGFTYLTYLYFKQCLETGAAEYVHLYTKNDGIADMLKADGFLVTETENGFKVEKGDKTNAITKI